MGVIGRIQALIGRPRGFAETVTASQGRTAGKRNEMAGAGRRSSAGSVLDEYNPDQKGRLALQIADKMRWTTGQVRALEVIRLPIESTQWIERSAIMMAPFDIAVYGGDGARVGGRRRG